MSTEIVYAKEKHFKSFYAALSAVAKERIYIKMIEPPPFEKVALFQSGLIDKNGPVYYAIENETVVGWCDIFPEENPRQNHRGGLGMGLLPSYRGKGLGSKLLESIVYPTKGKLIPKYKNADKYDQVIAVWTDYFNKKFNADPPLEPDVVKALIASESSLNPDPLGNRKVALGIAQITKKTLKILQDPKGEAKEFIFKDV